MLEYFLDFSVRTEYSREKYNHYAEQTQQKINTLRIKFHKNNKNTYLSNHRVSNNIANRVADQAQALYNDIVRYNESIGPASKAEENKRPIKRPRSESARKRRGNRKTRKTRKTRKMRR